MRRVIVILLVVLVFSAGLILDTAALLELAGAFLWTHARIAGAGAVVLALTIVVRRRWWPRRPAAPKRRAAAPRRPNGTRPPRAATGRTRKSTGKGASAR